MEIELVIVIAFINISCRIFPGYCIRSLGYFANNPNWIFAKYFVAHLIF